MATRGTIAILGTPLAVVFIASACTPTTRYRVLSFFFDGVPQPGTGRAVEAAERAGVSREVLAESPQVAQAKPGLTFHAHPPYRRNQCGSCHDRRTGGMFRSLEEGLCVSCHRPLVADVTYLHGPVVVNDCTFCHHYHGSPHPKMLLDDPADLCFRCHDSDDLTQEDHHAAIEGELCFTCHDPHGADNRFFLKRAAN